MLADNSEKWKPRLAALEELEQIAANAESDPDILSKEVFSALKVPIQQQLNDLRSQIVRAACNVTTQLAKVGGHRARNFLSFTMPQLIAMSAGANKVMASFALECSRDVVAHVQVHKAIPPLCELCQSNKNKTIVETSIECLKVALGTWDSFRRSDADLIMNAIETCLAAASSKARATAREAYWSFQALYPDRSKKIFKKLDARTINLIAEAKPSLSPPKDRGEAKADDKDNSVGEEENDNADDLSGGDSGVSDQNADNYAGEIDVRSSPMSSPTRSNGTPRSSGSPRLPRSPRSPRAVEDVPYEIGDRVLVTDQRLPAVVRFVGKTEFAHGMWIGCEIIGKSKGKNSGDVKGVNYFECPKDKGLFVRVGNLIFDDDPVSIDALEQADETGGEGSDPEGVELAAVGESEDVQTEEANGSEDPPPAPAAGTALQVPASTPTMVGDANGVAMQLLNAHRSHVDGVLECLRAEMEKLAEFEAHGDGSAHRVAEYASCIAESMHKREQMLEAMYQRLGALCASLAQAE